MGRSVQFGCDAFDMIRWLILAVERRRCAGPIPKPLCESFTSLPKHVNTGLVVSKIPAFPFNTLYISAVLTLELRECDAITAPNRTFYS